MTSAALSMKVTSFLFVLVLLISALSRCSGGRRNNRELAAISQVRRGSEQQIETVRELHQALSGIDSTDSPLMRSRKMLPWQLNWILKNFGTHLLLQELETKQEQEPVELTRSATAAAFVRKCTHWIQGHPLFRQLFITGIKAVSAVLVGTFIVKKIANWYAGMSEYDVLLDPWDYNYHSYGIPNLEGSVGISPLVNMNKTLLAELDYQGLYDRMISSMERAYPQPMKSYALQMHREIDSNLDQALEHLRACKKRLYYSTRRRLAETQLEIEGSRRNHPLRRFQTQYLAKSAAPDKGEHGKEKEPHLYLLQVNLTRPAVQGGELQLLAGFQRSVTVLQARQAEAQLRLTRMQVLSAANEVEDLVRKWRTRGVKISSSVRRIPFLPYFSHYVGFTHTGIRATSLQGMKAALSALKFTNIMNPYNKQTQPGTQTLPLADTAAPAELNTRSTLPYGSSSNSSPAANNSTSHWSIFSYFTGIKVEEVVPAADKGVATGGTVSDSVVPRHVQVDDSNSSGAGVAGAVEEDVDRVSKALNAREKVVYLENLLKELYAAAGLIQVHLAAMGEVERRLQTADEVQSGWVETGAEGDCADEQMYTVEHDGMDDLDLSRGAGVGVPSAMGEGSGCGGGAQKWREVEEWLTAAQSLCSASLALVSMHKLTEEGTGTASNDRSTSDPTRSPSPTPAVVGQDGIRGSGGGSGNDSSGEGRDEGAETKNMFWRGVSGVPSGGSRPAVESRAGDSELGGEEGDGGAGSAADADTDGRPALELDAAESSNTSLLAARGERFGVESIVRAHREGGGEGEAKGGREGEGRPVGGGRAPAFQGGAAEATSEHPGPNRTTSPVDVRRLGSDPNPSPTATGESGYDQLADPSEEDFEDLLRGLGDSTHGGRERDGVHELYTSLTRLEHQYRTLASRRTASLELQTGLETAKSELMNHFYSIGLKRRGRSGLLGLLRIRLFLRLSFWVGIVRGAFEGVKRSEDIKWGAKEIYGNAANFVERRITTPSMSILNDVLLNKKVSLSDKEALVDAKRSLGAMLNDFLKQYKPDLSDAERKRLVTNLDMRPISLEFETELQRPLQNIISGRIARLVLIQLQFVKKELLVAMEALDDLFSSNQVNLQLMAVTPAVMSLFALQALLKMGTAAIKSSSTGRVTESVSGIHRDLRVGMRQIERLLCCPSAGAGAGLPGYKSQLEGGGVRADMGFGDGATDKWASANGGGGGARGAGQGLDLDGRGKEPRDIEDIGRMLSLLYRLQLLLLVNATVFDKLTLEQLQEDLRDLSDPYLSAAQCLSIIQRITRAYVFLQPPKSTWLLG